jgi:hypothetical protein
MIKHDCIFARGEGVDRKAVFRNALSRRNLVTFPFLTRVLEEG